MTCISHRSRSQCEGMLVLKPASKSGVEGKEWKFNRHVCSWRSQKSCISAALRNVWGWDNLC